MRSYAQLKNIISGLALCSLLSACGGEDPLPPSPYGTLGYGNCGAPLGNYLKSVTGNLGGGLLQVQLFTSPDGSISAVGQLSIPNMSLFFDPSGGGSLYGGPQNLGAPFAACLSSNAPGRLEDYGPYQNIYLSLVGPSVQVQMGSGGTAQPYVRNDALMGSVYMNIAGFPAGYWIMAE